MSWKSRPGKFIAKLCKSPAGYTGLVTGGAAAAMVVGYAGMMTEDLEPRMRDIPDVSNFPKNEIIHPEESSLSV